MNLQIRYAEAEESGGFTAALPGHEQPRERIFIKDLERKEHEI